MLWGCHVVINSVASYRQHHPYGRAQWSGDEERRACHLPTSGPQAHAQLQSQLQLQRNVQPEVSTVSQCLRFTCHYIVTEILLCPVSGQIVGLFLALYKESGFYVGLFLYGVTDTGGGVAVEN